jgi:hypothetical protein
VLRIRDVFPDPGSEFFPSRRSTSKILSILNQKMFFKVSEIWLGLIPDQDPEFLPIPDPGVKKAPDPDPQHCSKSSVFMLLGVCISWWKPKDWVQSEWDKKIKAKVSYKKYPQFISTCQIKDGCERGSVTVSVWECPCK